MNSFEAEDRDDATRDSDPPGATSHLDAGLEAAFRSDRVVSLAETVDRKTIPIGTGYLLADRYKLVEAIGEGGMGIVWLAEQREPVKRKVAVKLVKAGMDSRSVLARFEVERQALAMMDHPNIAKVLDGGVTEQGRPFFVMELVKGIPLTEYCDQVQFSIRERLELFGQVCSAVQHAHQKGIIHRDLKPSNVLVTEVDGRPIVKVIDFGLAKALQGSQVLTDQSLHTAFGAVLGTPLYMAPEQLGTSALDVDTRADLYSLGVILYELLTGTTPIERQQLKQAAFEEMCRLIREQEPPRPSTRLSSSDALPSLAVRRHAEPAKLTRLVRGELDWIVMKALEKDRNRRYETANGLAMDVQRYLTGEAVLAAPSSKLYRIQKLLRKHRASAIAASLLMLSLAVGTIGTSVGFYNARVSAVAERTAKLVAQDKQAEAEFARQEAERERTAAERERTAAERERTAAELARNEAISQKTRAEAREQEAIDAVRRFGDSVANNRDLKNNPALESLRKTLLEEPLAFFQSLRTRLQSDPDTTPESLTRLAKAATDLGFLTDEIGDKQNALLAFEHVRSLYDRLARENPTVPEFQSALARSHNNIGNLLSDTGKPVDALEAYEQALEIYKRLVGENPTVIKFQSALAVCHNNIGLLLSNTGKPTEALTAYEQALKIQKRLASENPTVPEFQSALARSYNNIGSLLSYTGKPAVALTASERALEIRERLASENPSVTEFQSALARSHNNIGNLLSDTGKPAEALTAYEQALKIQNRLASENPTVMEFQSALARSYNSLGLLLRAAGKPVEALTAYEQALKIRERLAGENPTVTEFQSNVGATLNNISLIALNLGNFVDARNSLREAVEFQKRALATHVNHPTYRQFLRNHYRNLLKAAFGLNDVPLAREARAGLAELLRSEPAAKDLEERVQAAIGGEPPNDVLELLELGEFAYDTARFALGTRFFASVLEQEPGRAADRQLQIAYNAACCAVLAAGEQSVGEPKLDEPAKQNLRQQALTWLQDELQRWQAFLKSAPVEQHAAVAQTLKHWQTDPDLLSIRDAQELATIPEDMRKSFEALWSNVADTLAHASLETQSGEKSR